MMDPAGQNNWPVYLLQSLTAAAQPRSRGQPTVHAAAPGQPGHSCPAISVQHLQQQVCEIYAEYCVCTIIRSMLAGVR